MNNRRKNTEEVLIKLYEARLNRCIYYHYRGINRRLFYYRTVYLVIVFDILIFNKEFIRIHPLDILENQSSSDKLKNIIWNNLEFFIE